MQNISIKEQLKKLVDMQKIDESVYEINEKLQTLPAEIKAIQAEFESKKAHLKSLEDQLKQIQLTRKQHEVDLQTKEGEISKGDGQLMEIKTNKEYQAKITEIESLKADKSQIEEKILLSYDEADDVQKKIDEEKARLTEEEKSFKQREQEVNVQINDHKQQLETHKKDREAIRPEVQSTILTRYERILENKGGLAIVPLLNGNVCGGCMMNLPPQTRNLLKMQNDLINCEMCTRLLYLEDDL